MNLLAVLFPRVRAEVLRLLFADASAEFHLRDIARRSGLALGTIQTELAKLSAAQLVVSERDGNRRYYRANAAHPLFPTIRQLVRQTTPPQAFAPPAPSATRPPSSAHVPPVTLLPATSAAPPAVTSATHTLTLNEID